MNILNKKKKFFIITFISIGLNLTYGMDGNDTVFIIPKGTGTSAFQQELSKLIRQGVIKRVTPRPHKQELKKDEKKPRPVKMEEEMVSRKIKKITHTQEELKAIKELNCLNDFEDFSNEIGKLATNDKEILLRNFFTLQDLYEKYRDIKEYMQRNTSFFFCCGLFAYYLSNENNIDNLKEWFYKNLEIEVSEENAIKLMEKSQGDHAYFFLQNLKSEKSE